MELIHFIATIIGFTCIIKGVSTQSDQFEIKPYKSWSTIRTPDKGFLLQESSGYRNKRDTDDDTEVKRLRRQNVEESFSGVARLLSPSAFSKISETLGALNTVGRYLVNMTRSQHEITPTLLLPNVPENVTNNPGDSVPDAILTLTKNVFGQNVTNTIQPLIKGVDAIEEVMGKKKVQRLDKRPPILAQNSTVKNQTTLTVPKISEDDVEAKENENRCTTPQGRPGRCEDLSVCPELLLDLGGLRDSLCFKKLFVPGVCCAVSGGSTILTTQRPFILTHRPTSISTTPASLILKPINQIPQLIQQTTTKRPYIPVQTINVSPSTDLGGNEIDGPFQNHVDENECGQQEYTSGRIVGGVEAANGDWPWLAAIFLHGAKRTEFWCGGSLIGLKYVLTAAHCTRDSRQRPFAARQFTVRLGDIDLSTDSEPSAPVTYKVKEVRAHQRFSRVGFYNDIAVLVLEDKVRKSKYVIPICLPKPGTIPSKERLAGRRATVVGWGTTYYGGKESTVQRQADLPIWRNEDCNRAYFQPITDNFLCAGYSEGGVDACQGDSGGPLMIRVGNKWFLLGIVSFGNKCGEPGYPGVYTRLSEYVEWIKENTVR